MEMSHRSKVYQGIIDSAESLLREVMNIPDSYKVLFLQGGASSQFAMVPMNLMTKSGKADFVLTGQWATKAYKEEMCIRDSLDLAYFLNNERQNPAKGSCPAVPDTSGEASPRLQKP